jgi:hypothetical protein
LRTENKPFEIIASESLFDCEIVVGYKYPIQKVSKGFSIHELEIQDAKISNLKEKLRLHQLVNLLELD